MLTRPCANAAAAAPRSEVGDEEHAAALPGGRVWMIGRLGDDGNDEGGDGGGDEEEAGGGNLEPVGLIL